MKFVPALTLAALAAVASWLGLMWVSIFLGHVVHPESIHNSLAMSGVLIVAPLAGISSGLLLYRMLRMRKS